MQSFTIDNFYLNVSPWNKELLFDGIIYTSYTGSMVYLFTNTGIFRYTYNDKSTRSDYGVFNRDIAYVCYEIPSIFYRPNVLAAIVGFINRNGVFCTLNMADGALRKYGSWNFDISQEKQTTIWSFISELGNSCFVVGDHVLDVSFRDQDNFVGSLVKMLVSGFIKFTDIESPSKKYELIIIAGALGETTGGNFVQAALSFGGFHMQKIDYGKTFYLRDEDGAMISDALEAVKIITRNFDKRDGEEGKVGVKISSSSIFNTNINKALDNEFFKNAKSFFMIGFDKVLIKYPKIVNPLPSLIQVPKVSIGVADAYFSALTKYLSTQKETKLFSNYYIDLQINEQKFQDVPLVENKKWFGSLDQDPDSSCSRFVEFTTENATDTHMKIIMSIQQKILVGDNMVQCAMCDSLYIQPMQMVYSLFR